MNRPALRNACNTLAIMRILTDKNTNDGYVNESAKSPILERYCKIHNKRSGAISVPRGFFVVISYYFV